MVPGGELVLERLRARRVEIERAIFARVQEIAPGAAERQTFATGVAGEQAAMAEPGACDAEYLAGLRAAVAAAVDFVLSGIERGQELPQPIPSAAVVQAQRAVRSGVSLEIVLRRYTAGYALLSDFIVQEAESCGRQGELRRLLALQAGLLERLTSTIAQEYQRELQRARRSRSQRRLELVRALLAGEYPDPTELDARLDYKLEAEHIAVIATGPGSQQALRQLAKDTGRRLLCVERGQSAVWAWFGGERHLDPQTLEGIIAELSMGDLPSGAVFAVGEPARGLAGWRLTHHQAQSALLVALHTRKRLTRYVEVALLAAALKDETLMSSLGAIYLAPLADARGGGAIFRETLRAYLSAEHNASSAAAALGVARSTVENRLRAMEKRLGRTLQGCLAELQIALALEDLGCAAGINGVPMDKGQHRRSSIDCIAGYAQNHTADRVTLP